MNEEPKLNGCCPACKSNDVENDDYEYPTMNIIIGYCHCNECKHEFSETYYLVEQEVTS